jgi:hypothetical protein
MNLREAKLRKASFIALFLALLISHAHAQRDFDRDRSGEWVLLGEQRVGFNVDRDVIRIGLAEGWFRERAFRALHFFAERNDVYLIRLGLRYFNGYSEEMDVDRVIRQGGRLAVDLPGTRSYIREIELIYRSREGGGRALVKVYGEPARFADRPDRVIPRDWELLGEQRVSFDVERDVINVRYGDDWYRNRRFRALRFMVDRNDVEMRRIRLTYSNGYEEEIDVNRLIPRDSDLAVDLRGERAYIRRIEMIYRSGSDSRRPALIRVFGEPARFADRPGGDIPRDWDLLGEQRVGFEVDRDVINIGHGEDWYRNRRYRALRFVADRNDVELRRIRLAYINGDTEDFEIDRVIPEGSALTVDLRGERSYIRRIEMVYRSRSDYRGRALIRVYGEPARFADRPDDGRRTEWVELGCRRVDLFGRDRDVIEVGRREGRFRAIRLHTQGADVEMLDLRVIYSGGEPDDIRVQRLLRVGERTQPLDLRGWTRRIDRIELVYRRMVRPSDVVLGERVRRATVCAEGLQEARTSL